MIAEITISELTPDTIAHNGVVRIHTKRRMKPDEFLREAERLGSPVGFALSKYRPADFPPQVTLIDSHGDGIMAAPRGFGEGWHQDSTYLARPPSYTLLHAIDAPPAGGATRFADTRVAQDDLSSEDWQILRSLRLEHSVRHTYRVTPTDVGRSLGEISAGLSAAHHDVVQRHPRGGSDTLCLSPLYTLPYLEQRNCPIIAKTVECIVRRSVSYQWSVGDILAWDNRIVMHAAEGYSGEARRRLIRTLVHDQIGWNK